MVIGNQHRDPQRVGMIDPRMGRDPVIDGHDHLRTAGVGLIDHFRAESVAVFKTVRHQIRDVIAAQRAQAEHAQRGAGCAVGVEIPYYHNARVLTQGVVEHFSGFFDAVQLLPGQHPFYATFKILSTTHAAAGVEALQQRREIVRQINRFNRLAAAQCYRGFHADYLPLTCFWCASRNSFISFGP